MTVAQTRSAARKMRIRYGGARRSRSVGEIISEQRRVAAQEMMRKVVKKK